MPEVINLDRCFEKFEETFSPKIVGTLNGQMVLLVRCEGDKIPWHSHDHEDELFMVLEGVLEVHLRDKVLTLNPGEFTIVPQKVEHRILPQGEVKLMLFEPQTIKHTGDVQAEVTQQQYERIVP